MLVEERTAARAAKEEMEQCKREASRWESEKKVAEAKAAECLGRARQAEAAEAEVGRFRRRTAAWRHGF